ncbi:hypothetical protein [Anaeromyxobacter oryzae]|uniref:Lipoprotein n=1 Tax=Anaeromyxobacter oryzae TaxID=2918170 RepID=A0ABM7WNJ1_9BACT|nr:hypothetical protein [Anaeromyxobacter oryzae]BDG01033.1 hypothetical protein AMOR_00290 [Anaeromyxobacter oryzae]
MPSRLLVSLAAAVALTWAIACNRGGTPAPQAPAADAPPAASAPAPVAAAPSAPAAPEKADPKPTPAEVAAIEHPHVQK